MDRSGKTVDFLLRAHRDTSAAKAFFRKAIRQQGVSPKTVTLDGCAASHRTVREMKEDGELCVDTKVRSSKYLNNLIEQDHRNIKSRTNVILGFKQFGSAAITIAGIELLESAKDNSVLHGCVSKIPLHPQSGILSFQLNESSGSIARLSNT